MLVERPITRAQTDFRNLTRPKLSHVAIDQISNQSILASLSLARVGPRFTR